VKLLHGHDDTVAQWVGNRLDGYFPPPYRAAGIIDAKGVLCGGFVLVWHHNQTAEMSMATTGDVVTHGIAKSFFTWAFDECGVWRLQIRTSKRNRAIKKAAPKLGFRFEGAARDWYGPGSDALVWYMTPPLCRWIKDVERLQEKQRA